MYKSRFFQQDVFIIGAGFSKAISKKMPVLDDLRDLLLRQLNHDRELLATPFIKKDLEIALSFLSMRHPWLDEGAYLRNRSLAIRLSTAIADTISKLSDEVRLENAACCEWLVKLVHWMHERQSVVITFNYDTLLESAFGTIETGQGGTLLYYLDAEALYPIEFSGHRGQFGVRRLPTSEVLKLHGSTNWRYFGRPSYFGEPLRQIHIPYWHQPESTPSAKSGRVPLIVPPLAEKAGYFENEDVRFLWSRASEAITSARRLFFLGYSFPLTDLSVRMLIESSCQMPTPCYVVNRPKCRSNYRKLPKALQLDWTWTGDDPIPDFVNWLTGPPSWESDGSQLGSVERAIREHLRAGAFLHTPYFGEQFKILEIATNGLILEVGPAQVTTTVSWKALESVTAWLQERKGPQHIGSCGWDAGPVRPPNSLHEQLTKFTNRAIARVAAAILDEARVVKLNQQRTMIEMHPYFATEYSANRPD